MTEVREMFGRTHGERSGEVRVPRPYPSLTLPLAFQNPPMGKRLYAHRRVVAGVA